MIGVFKTSVNKKKEAINLVSEIEAHFPEYKVNFDLTDVDNILRIENKTGVVACDLIIQIMQSFYHQCEILE